MRKLTGCNPYQSLEYNLLNPLCGAGLSRPQRSQLLFPVAPSGPPPPCPPCPLKGPPCPAFDGFGPLQQRTCSHLLSRFFTLFHSDQFPAAARLSLPATQLFPILTSSPYLSTTPSLVFFRRKIKSNSSHGNCISRTPRRSPIPSSSGCCLASPPLIVAANGQASHATTTALQTTPILDDA